MSETKYTPGPWKIGGMFGLSITPVYDAYKDVAWVNREDIHQDEVNGNLKLIAAAPELLEALEAVVSLSDRKHDVWDKAKAAIAKAKGGRWPQ